MTAKMSFRRIACILLPGIIFSIHAVGCNKKNTGGAISKPVIRAKIEGCIMSLMHLKTMMDAAAATTGNPSAPQDPNEVCKLMSGNDFCTVQNIESQIAASCAAPDGAPWTWAASVDFSDQAGVKIHARAPQTQCAVCVSSAGSTPMNPDDCSPTISCP